MGISAYTSLWYSGVYRDLPQLLQLQIAGIYASIKLANELEIQFVRTFTQASTSVTKEFRQGLGIYLRSMNTFERELIGKISGVISALQAEYHTETSIAAP